MNTLNDAIRDLSMIKSQLEKGEKRADAKRVGSLINLLSKYDLGGYHLYEIGEELAKRKKKSSPKKKKPIDPEALRRSAEQIVIAFRNEDIVGLKDALGKRSVTVPVIKTACKELGISYQQSKAKTVSFLVEIINDFQKQSMRR